MLYLKLAFRIQKESQVRIKKNVTHNTEVVVGTESVIKRKSYSRSKGQTYLFSITKLPRFLPSLPSLPSPHPLSLVIPFRSHPSAFVEEF